MKTDIILTEEQIEFAIEHTLECRPLELLHRKLGFNSRRAFLKYLSNNPEVNTQLLEARKLSCRYLEDELLYVNDNHDPKAARVKLEAIKSLLVFLDPSKYSQKIDLNVNQTVSIKANLNVANDRISAALKDVTPVQIVSKAE